MSALAEKLKSAGVDTVGARLVAECTQAIRVYQDPWKAWQHVGSVFGHDFIRSLMGDMQNVPGTAAREASQNSAPVASSNPAPDVSISPYKPRAPDPKVADIVRRARSKYFNSGGIAWSDVSLVELTALKRDGGEAEALLNACPHDTPNDGRTLGDVLGIKMVDQIIAQVRAKSMPPSTLGASLRNML